MIVTLPDRSLERAALAAAIDRHREATAQYQRVADALGKAEDRVVDLAAASRKAEKALADARAAAPQLLIDATLAEAADPDAVVLSERHAAEGRLQEAGRRLADAREARSILYEEVGRAEAAVGIAKRAVEMGVDAALKADPAVDAVQREYRRALDRACRMARILRSLPRTGVVLMPRFEAHGVSFTLGQAASAIGQPSFFPELAWTEAVSALRESADAQLPDLPPDNDGDGRAAPQPAAPAAA